jgi:hypothetical protein
MEIPFKGRHRKEDYMLLARVNRNPQTRKGGMNSFDPNKLLMVAGAILIIFPVLDAIMRSSPGSVQFPQCFPFLIAAIVFFSGYRGYRRWLTVWRTSDAWQSEYQGVITDEHISSTTEDSESTYSWNRIKDYYLINDLMLLFDNTGIYYVFPKHFFASEEDWQAFIALVREKLPPDSG